MINFIYFHFSPPFAGIFQRFQLLILKASTNSSKILSSKIHDSIEIVIKD
jgi:hypothetical protein